MEMNFLTSFSEMALPCEMGLSAVVLRNVRGFANVSG